MIYRYLGSLALCAYWLTTSQAFSLAYDNPNQSQAKAVQKCMTVTNGQWHYTDKCISRAFPTKTLLIDEECLDLAPGKKDANYDCRQVTKLIKNGVFLYN